MQVLIDVDYLTLTIYQIKFSTLKELEVELGGHIWWYNNKRLHSSLGYKTRIEYALTV